MSNKANTLLATLEKSALEGDPSARMVMEHPITQFLIKELVETPFPAYIRFDVPLAGRLLKDGKRRIIHGYASVETIDKQQELVTISALQKAWERLKTAGEKYANINLEHSNITIGKVLLDEIIKDSEGKDYWSHVDDRGLYIVAELRDDIEIADRVWDMANKGELNAYSIGGRALKKRLVNKGGQSFFQIDDLELYEVTICKRGKNPLSGFEVLKSYLDNGLISQEMFLQKSEELKKSEKLVHELAFLPNLMGKTLVIRDNFICQVGSTVEKQEGHDFDLLVRMDVDNPIRRHIETRILKSLPAELWDKVEFIFGDEGGPHDTFRPLYHLALVPAQSTRVEMAKSDSGIPSSEQLTEHLSEKSDSRLKNIEGRESSEDMKMSEENKAIGAPGLVGTGTGPQTGGATGTTREGPELATLRAKVKEMEAAMTAVKEAAAKVCPPDEKEAAKKPPYPEEKEAAAKKPYPEEKEGAKKPYPEEKEGAAKKPYPEEKEAGDKKGKYPEADEEKAKKKYPYPEEKEASEDDPEVFEALEGLEAKGKLPEGLRRWMEERRKKTKKASDSDERIAGLEAKVEKIDKTLGNIESLLKGKEPEVKKSEGLSEEDRHKIAVETAEILKSGSPTVKKSAATGDIGPESGAEKPTTLADIHGKSWKEIDEIANRQRVRALQGGA